MSRRVSRARLFRKARVRLDAIITVVDAFHLPRNLSLGGPWQGFAAAPTLNPGAAGEAEALRKVSEVPGMPTAKML